MELISGFSETMWLADKPNMKRFLFSLFVAVLSASAATREEAVRNDLKEVQATGLWLYNDLSKGIEQAEQTGKPLLIVFRCVP